MQVVNQQIIKTHEAPSRATYRVYNGDIITATSGASTGTYKQATALITEDEDSAICSNGFAVIRNIREIEPMFLLAYMRTEFFLRQVRRMMTGHAIPSISLDDLSKILVPIPSKQDQTKITESILSIQSMRKESQKIGDKVILETEKLIKTEFQQV
jgi:type I restriction enzyme M protein